MMRFCYLITVAAVILIIGVLAVSAYAQKAVDLTPEELNKHIDTWASSNNFSGVILIGRDDKIVFHKAYGFASREYKVLNDLITRFNLGSINKSFTTAAIAQLLEKKKISLEDPISKYFSGFPDEVGTKVTIKHLLGQTAGWGDYWDNPKFLEGIHTLRTVSDYMAFIKDMPLDSEPGTKQQHCNTCFEVLGAIIEKASGIDYFNYIRENIYKPASMLHSDSYPRNSINENLAQGYTMPPFAKVKGNLINNIYILPVRGTPAGGGYSTAEDLFKYVKALRKNKLLSEEYTKLMMNGFEAETNRGEGLNEMMAGGAPGVTTFVGFQYPPGVVVIGLSNQNEPNGIEFGESMM